MRFYTLTHVKRSLVYRRQVFQVFDPNRANWFDYSRLYHRLLCKTLLTFGMK